MASRTVAQGCTVVVDGVTYQAGEKVTVSGDREKRLSILLEPGSQPKKTWTAENSPKGDSD